MESNKKGLEQRIAEWEREVEETGQALAGKKEEHSSAISTVADLMTDLEASSAELEELKISRQTCMSECISSTEDAAALQSRQRTAIDRVTEVHNQVCSLPYQFYFGFFNNGEALVCWINTPSRSVSVHDNLMHT